MTDPGPVLAAFIERLLPFIPVPGGSVVVVDRDGTVATHTFGLADVGAAIPVALGHRFEIGSISKVFTSLLINQLADEGLIDLDAPITDVLPWVQLGTPTAQCGDAAVTPRHLLNHTAGLILGADSLPDERAQVWSLRDRVRSGPPGARFHYSNAGFMLLGQAAVAVTGQPLAELMRTRLLVPMGLPDACAQVTHADRATMATGYWPLHDDRPWAPGDSIAPATWFEVAAADGNIAANIGELGQFLRFLLGDGSVDGRQVISAAAMRRMIEWTAPTGEDIVTWGASPGAEDSRYGLGVNVERVNGNECLTHGGGMVGYASFVLADRTAGIGVGVLTNGNGDCPAAQLIARVAHALYAAAALGQRLPDVPDASGMLSASSVPAGLRGTFLGQTPGGPAELTIEATGLGAFQVSSGQTKGLLYRAWNDAYVTDHPQLRTFHLRFDGAGWTAGPVAFEPLDSAVPATPLDPRLAALVGHYRCYSPWYPTLRIVTRAGRLLLVAPGGVEAPGDELELVELAPGVFRIGADPWLPERLEVGPVVEGQAISVTRDGAIYSRAFTN